MAEEQDSSLDAPPPGSGAHALDVAALQSWMEDKVPDFRGPLSVEKFAGGQSNPTFRLSTPTRNFVMRRKPLGPIHRSAHAVDREYRVLQALGRQGFPVPAVLGLCTDEAVIGSWFYVMELVEGRVFWNSALPELSAPERAAAFDSMNETIARLHMVDVTAAGLEDFGRGGNYVGRQIDRFAKQYRADEAAGRLDVMDRLIEWLLENMPSQEGGRSIVHGDFKIDNLMFHPTEPRVIAVLDWELSTLGDPLADFAYNMMMYRMPAGLGASLASDDRPRAGLPSEAEYIAAYCRRTGRDGFPHLSYYVAFNMFRLAAIIHGIGGRVIRGNASHAQAHQHVARFEPLAQAAWAQAQRAQAEA